VFEVREEGEVVDGDAEFVGGRGRVEEVAWVELVVEWIGVFPGDDYCCELSENEVGCGEEGCRCG